MSKLIRRFLIALFIVGILLVGISLYFSQGEVGVKYTENGWRYLYDTNLQDFKEILIPDDVSNLHINLNTCDVNMMLGDENKIVIKTDNKYEYDFEKVSKTFTLSSVKSSKRFMNNVYIGIHGINSNYTNSVTVYLKDAKVLETLYLDIESGEVSVSDLILKKLNVNNKYNDIFVKNINADIINVSSNSGDILLTDINSDFLEIESKYADYNISNIDIKNNITIISNSGSYLIKNIKANTLSLDFKYTDIDITGANINVLTSKSNSGELAFFGIISESSDVLLKYTDVVLNLDGDRKNYNVIIEQKTSDVYIDNEEIEGNYNNNTNNNAILNINSNSGSVDINFNK